MKTLNFLRNAVPMLVGAMCVIACQKENTENEQNVDNGNDLAKNYVVTLDFTGEIVNDSMINSDVYKGKNLYYIQAFEVTDKNVYEKYAHGLFSTKDISIELEPGNKYRFKSTVVANGMEKIRHLEGENKSIYYEAPFETVLTDKFVYTDDFSDDFIGNGETETADMEEGSYTRPNLNRYFGDSEVYSANDSVGGMVDMCMMKTTFMLKITTKNFNEGTLKFIMDGGPEFVMEYPNTELTAQFAFEKPVQAFMTDINNRKEFTYNYKEEIKIDVVYEKDGNEKSVETLNFKAVRNRLNLLSVILPLGSNDENGFDINIDDEEMTEDDEVVDFEGGLN